MTKEDEIEIIQNAARKLGKDSYLGPWLERAIPFLKHEIEQDIFPLSYGEGERIAQSRVSDAEKSACEIIKSAVNEADAIAKRAKRDLESDLHARRESFKRRLADLASDL